MIIIIVAKEEKTLFLFTLSPPRHKVYPNILSSAITYSWTYIFQVIKNNIIFVLNQYFSKRVFIFIVLFHSFFTFV